MECLLGTAYAYYEYVLYPIYCAPSFDLSYVVSSNIAFALHNTFPLKTYEPDPERPDPSCTPLLARNTIQSHVPMRGLI